jgi:hypothetical protein
MEGIFDNPMGGIDLGELGLGKPSNIPDESHIKDEDELDSNSDNFLGDDDNTRAFDLHQGRIEIKEEEEEDTNELPEDFNLFNAFQEEGLIELGEGEEIPKDADLEWFSTKAKEKVQKEVESALEEYKETLPEEIKYLLDNIDAGVSIYDLVNADKKIMEVASITEEKLSESESLQKDVLAKYLKATGESDEAIKETLLDYEDSGLLEKMAKRAHSKLVVQEQKEKERLVQAKKEEQYTQKQKYQEWLGDLKENINKKEEIFPGVKLTDKQRKDLYKGITEVDKTGKNAVMKYRDSNPDFDLQVAYIATVLKGDFSVLENIATTKATRDLKEKASNLSNSGSKPNKSLKGVDMNVIKKALNIK